MPNLLGTFKLRQDQWTRGVKLLDDLDRFFVPAESALNFFHFKQVAPAFFFGVVKEAEGEVDGCGAECALERGNATLEFRNPGNPIPVLKPGLDGGPQFCR